MRLNSRLISEVEGIRGKCVGYILHLLTIFSLSIVFINLTIWVRLRLATIP